MRILIVYNLLRKNDRSTIFEHLYCFKRYSGEQCYYLNTARGIPRFITKTHFDLIIYHYSFLSFTLRWPEAANQVRFKQYGLLKELRGYKIAIPQDEYVYSDILSEFFSAFGVKTVFTCLPETEWQKVYPMEKSGLRHYLTVFPGYVDELSLEKLRKTGLKRHDSRPIDIGYRARKLPYWVGRHGTIKWELTQKFIAAADGHNLYIDLSNDANDVFLGAEWYKFLAKCRVVLGCESGASLHDPDGSIFRKVNEYVGDHPESSFDEVERACFPGLDGNLRLFSLSPRHFEACITKTCQALVEGEYGGIIKPGVHYIEIKKDGSNINDVIRQMKDIKTCEQLADKAYRDIVESGLYTYRNFAQMVLDHVRSVHQFNTENSYSNYYYLYLLTIREWLPFSFSSFSFNFITAKSIAYGVIFKLGLYPLYTKIKTFCCSNCKLKNERV
jgi:hypothetical protein